MSAATLPRSYSDYDNFPANQNTASSCHGYDTQQGYYGNDGRHGKETMFDNDCNGLNGGDYIRVSPSKTISPTRDRHHRPDLCSTFRNPEHESPYASSPGYTTIHDAPPGQRQGVEYNGHYKSVPTSSHSAGLSRIPGDNNGLRQHQEDLYNHSKYPSITRNYQALDTIPDDATTTSGSYVVDPLDLCTETDGLFSTNDTKA